MLVEQTQISARCPGGAVVRHLGEFVFWFNRCGNPTAAFQTLLGLGSEHGPVRSAMFTGAQDRPCYSESDELPNENTATE